MPHKNMLSVVNNRISYIFPQPINLLNILQ